MGSVSRLHPSKRLDTAIRLLADQPPWHLALAGQGPQQAPLRALAEQLGVLSRVHFIVEIAPERIGAFLRGLDVFVFPTAAETFGLAAVEAANAGVAAVVNDLPVLRECCRIKASRRRCSSMCRITPNFQPRFPGRLRTRHCARRCGKTRWG